MARKDDITPPFRPRERDLQMFDRVLDEFPKALGTKLRAWLRDVDFSMITARDQYDEILRNLMMMALYGCLLPTGDQLIKGIAEARRCVTDHAKIFKEYLNVDLPDQINEHVKDQIEELKTAYLEALPEENREKFLEKLKENAQIDET